MVDDVFDEVGLKVEIFTLPTALLKSFEAWTSR